MYKVIVRYQRPDYRWDTTICGPYIMKEEADAVHEKQALIAKDLLKNIKIIDYQIETINTIEKEKKK